MSKRVAESFGLALEADSRIDLEAGIIRGVKILGSKSKNGRTYPPKLLAERYAVYESAQVYADHSYDQLKTGRARSMNEMGGVLRHVCYRGESVYGDLDCLLDTEAGRIIMGAARKCPDRFGLSPFHLIESEKQKDGSEVVTAIIECLSVDAVTRPATTKTLFEEETMPDQPVAAAAPAAMSLEEWLGLGAAIIMAHPDYDDTEKLAATKELFKFKGKILGDGTEEGPDGEPPAEGEPPAGEAEVRRPPGRQARELAEIRNTLRALTIRQLAGEALPLDAPTMQLLLGLPDDGSVVTYLDNLRRQRRPRYSSGPARSQGRAVAAEAQGSRSQVVPRLTAGADKEAVKKFYRS